MREIRRRLSELKKENEELKNLLSITGKNRYEYETKVNNFFSPKISITSFVN
jgi:hypothetical protein